MATLTKKVTDDPYGAAILIRRLIMEQGMVYWRRYLTALALMGISAAASAGATYILGQVINEAPRTSPASPRFPALWCSCCSSRAWRPTATP
jgi:hypothetical protein